MPGVVGACSARCGVAASGATAGATRTKGGLAPLRRATVAPLRVARVPGNRRVRVCARASASEFPAWDSLTNVAVNLHASVITRGDVFQIADAGAAEIELPSPDEIAGIQKGGWLGPITDALEAVLTGIDGGLEKLGVPYSYGFAILFLTLLVKAVTFPLTKKQVEGSIQMQAIQPKVKELQAMYANDPERLQMETARLYKEANFNPLAGCLPTFATLPVFIGLYRALSNAAAEGLLTDGFFWIPSLGGPASIASRTDGTGFKWLTDFSSGGPPLGWHDTIAYLILPVLLVVSQSASQKIMQPEQQNVDPSQQQTQAILKYLPLMIGFFSLNVPAGLTLYWFANNILSTAQTVYLRKTTKAPEAPAAIAGAGGLPMPGTQSGAQPVRVEYVPKSQRKSGGATSSAPKPPPPSIEPMPASLASEFTDFDDGPAKVLDVVQGVVVGGESESAGGKKGKKAKGSRKRKSK